MERNLRIVHLEDDPNDAELVRAVLETDGLRCDIEVVSTAEQLEEALGRNNVDVVLSDYSIPSFDGLAALRLVRRRSPDLPFILVSGAIGEDAAVDSLRSGVTDYVLKGRLSRLAPAVRRAVAAAEEQTKRRHAEEALLKTRERLMAVSRATSDVIWEWNIATGEVWWGENVQVLLGYTPAEMSDDLESWTSRLHPDDAESITKSVKATIDGGGRVWSGEYRFRRADGSYFHVLNRGYVLCDEAGRPARMIAVMMDITERKSLEEQLRQAQKIEAIGRLAGGIAHDFNNLMFVVLGYSEVSLAELESDHPMRGNLEQVHKAAQRAAGLTRQLLAFSRKQVLEPKNLDLNALLTEIGKMLRRLIGEDIDLVLHSAQGLGCIKADPGQIEQVVMNLAVNARDAMPDGGTLTIETANVDLDEAYARRHAGGRSGPHVMLAVSDTGIGMTPEVRARVFEPFFTTKELGKGTGLGLATVYGIVKQSGGYIWVYSEPGRGTTFKIYFPRVEEPADTMRQRDVAALPRGMETVLVVEDDKQVRELVNGSLQAYGYQVLAAGDAYEAVKIAEQHDGPIHLLVTDVILPKVGGRDLARRLKHRIPALKVLYMSGYTDDAIVHHGVLEPGVAFLQKPFALTALARKVRKVLDGES